MRATVQFREGTAGDRDAILALRALAFPDDDPEKRQPDFWNWEFIDGYAGAARIFIAEAGDEIVGHFAFIPQRFATPQIVRGALAVDVMTHPQFRRQKIFSRLASFAADRLRGEFPVVAAFQIREAVMSGMEAGGWRPAQQLPVLLKPLSLRSIAQDFGLPFGHPVAAPTMRIEPADDSIRPIRADDLEQIDALLATTNIRQNRSVEFLEWRYLKNPHWRYELDGFFDGNALRAFVVSRDSILRGLRSLAIADVGLEPGSEKSLRRLIRHVCANSRSRGRAVGAALLSRHHPAYRVLRRSGFLPGPHRFRLLLQVFDESQRRAAEAPWSLSWGDTDHL